jgi:ribonuclease P protein subunit RPR2
MPNARLPKSQKSPKQKVKGVPNKHLHARTTFLYQAATYLTLQSGTRETTSDIIENQSTRKDNHSLDGPSRLALELGSQLHTVSQKGQVRLSAQLKRSVCKVCRSVLVPGRTATQSIINESKEGKKPWADVLVLACTFCGGTKRYPVGAKRQQGKGKRRDKPADSANKEMDRSSRSTSQTLHTTTDQSPAPANTDIPPEDIDGPSSEV